MKEDRNDADHRQNGLDLIGPAGKWLCLRGYGGRRNLGNRAAWRRWNEGWRIGPIDGRFCRRGRRCPKGTGFCNWPQWEPATAASAGKPGVSGKACRGGLMESATGIPPKAATCGRSPSLGGRLRGRRFGDHCRIAGQALEIDVGGRQEGPHAAAVAAHRVAAGPHVSGRPEQDAGNLAAAVVNRSAGIAPPGLDVNFNNFVRQISAGRMVLDAAARKDTVNPLRARNRQSTEARPVAAARWPAAKAAPAAAGWPGQQGPNRDRSSGAGRRYESRRERRRLSVP